MTGSLDCLLVDWCDGDRPEPPNYVDFEFPLERERVRKRFLSKGFDSTP